MVMMSNNVQKQQNNLKAKLANCFGILYTVAILCISLGFVLGFKTCKLYYDRRLEEVVAVGGFLHKGKVYEVREKIVFQQTPETITPQPNKKETKK